MATLPHEIKMTVKPEGRPCWLYGITRDELDTQKRTKAFLHLITTRSLVIDASPLKGGHPGGQISRPVAIVEDENGRLREVELRQVQLLDTAEQLEESAAWEPKEEK